jgi:hypothetical protein
MRVHAEGGAPEVVAVPDTSGTSEPSSTRTPCPVGVGCSPVLPITGDASVVLLDLRTKAVTPLAKGVAAFHALPGYLVIMQADGSIRAAKFDAGNGRSFRPLSRWRKERTEG